MGGCLLQKPPWPLFLGMQSELEEGVSGEGASYSECCCHHRQFVEGALAVADLGLEGRLLIPSSRLVETLDIDINFLFQSIMSYFNYGQLWLWKSLYSFSLSFSVSRMGEDCLPRESSNGNHVALSHDAVSSGKHGVWRATLGEGQRKLSLTIARGSRRITDTFATRSTTQGSSMKQKLPATRRTEQLFWVIVTEVERWEPKVPKTLAIICPSGCHHHYKLVNTEEIACIREGSGCSLSFKQCLHTAVTLAHSPWWYIMDVSNLAICSPETDCDHLKRMTLHLKLSVSYRWGQTENRWKEPRPFRWERQGLQEPCKEIYTTWAWIWVHLSTNHSSLEAAQVWARRKT